MLPLNRAYVKVILWLGFWLCTSSLDVEAGLTHFKKKKTLWLGLNVSRMTHWMKPINSHMQNINHTARAVLEYIIPFKHFISLAETPVLGTSDASYKPKAVRLTS